jgi:hypothetical protein
MRWVVHVVRMEEEERCIQGFGRRPEGKRRLPTIFYDYVI